MGEGIGGSAVAVCSGGRLVNMGVRGSVVKVGVDREEINFVNALELLVHNEDTRRTIGEKGKKFAAEECTVPQYCRALVSLETGIRRFTDLQGTGRSDRGDREYV